MTVTVHGPGGVTVHFPDGTDAATINQVMSRATGGEEPAANPADAGGLDATLRGIARGVTGNWIDTPVGAIGGAWDALGLGPEGSKGTFQGGFDRTVNRAHALDQAADVNYPVLSTAGQVGGGIAQMAVLPEAAIARGLGIAGKAGTLGAKVGQAVAGGLAYGAESGAGAAQGGVGDTIKSGLEGGLTGMVAGAAGPIVSKGLGAAGGAAGRAIARPFRVARGAANPAGEAARRVSGALAADLGDPARAVTGMEQAQKAGLPIITADMGETTRALGRSAANTSPEGRGILDQALAARQAGQSDRVSSIIERAAPGVNAPETRAFLEQAAAKANKPRYDKAFLQGAGGIWTPGVETLTAAPEMQAAIAKSAITGANKAAARGQRPPIMPFIMDGGALKLNPAGKPLLKQGVRPTLEFWDGVKRNLDDVISVAQRKGEKEVAADAIALKSQLVSALDQAVPAYKAARSGAAAFFGAENASEAGSAFVRMKLGTNEMLAAQQALAKMSPAEKALFAEGFATKVLSDVKEVGDRYSLVGRIFNSPAARQRFTIALGKGAADKMEATMRVEHLMDLTKRALQGNSTTARQLAELGIAGGIGAYSGGGDLYDPTTWLSAALAYGILHGGKTALARIDTNVSREVARLLASNDPEIVKQAIDRVGKSPRLLHALRIGEGHFSRVLVPSLGIRGSPSLPSVASGAMPANADQR